MENDAPLVRFARRLRLVTIAVAMALVLVSVVAALSPEAGHVTLEAGGLPRGWASGVALVTAGLVVLALVQLVRMLGRIEKGERFTPGATRDFRGFALFLLVAAIARVVLAPLVQLALVLLAGGRRFHLSLDDADAVMLVVTAVLFLVARLFDEAARLEEDSRSIV